MPKKLTIKSDSQETSTVETSTVEVPKGGSDEWTPVAGYETEYVMLPNGTVRPSRSRTRLTPYIKGSTPYVQLFDANGKNTPLPVKRLIEQTFGS